MIENMDDAYFKIEEFRNGCSSNNEVTVKEIVAFYINSFNSPRVELAHDLGIPIELCDIILEEYRRLGGIRQSTMSQLKREVYAVKMKVAKPKSKIIWKDQMLLAQAHNEFSSVVSQKVNWILTRTERNGVGRQGRWGVKAFTLEELLEKITIREHPMNTNDFRYYDWIFGGTNFLWRLEFNDKIFKEGGREFLKTYLVYKPVDEIFSETQYIWNDERQKFEAIQNHIARSA